MNPTARALLAEVTRLETAGAIAHQRLRAIRWATQPAPVAASPAVVSPPDPTTTEAQR